MSLLETQNFLARLYTDETLRRTFLTEPEKIGEEYNLTEKEIVELAAILPDELNFFADSLFWKRLREVEKFLPLTRKVLDKDFEKCFRGFSQNFNPKSVKKHLEDAIEFCSFLQTKEIEPLWAKDLAKFEQARLIFNSNARNFIIERFNYDIKRILKELSRKDTKTQSVFPKRRTFAFWLKIGKITKHFIR